MSVELKDMKLLRISVCQIENIDKTSLAKTEDYQYGIKQNTQILLPTSFVLVVKRNLSSDWYKEQSQLNISGKIDTIEVSYFIMSSTLS